MSYTPGLPAALVTFNAPGTYASRPAAGNAGTFYVATDAPVQLWVDDGSAWHPMVGGQAYGTQPPAASTFTAVNQGASTLTDRNGALHYAGDADAGTVPRSYVTSLSASTAYVIAAIEMTAPYSGATPSGGVMMRESASGKMETWGFIGGSAANSAPQLQEAYYSNSTTQVTTANDLMFTPIVGVMFFRLRRSGTNMVGEVSVDGGANWVLVTSRATTTVFTTAPDQVGIFGMANSNVPANFNVLSYASGS